MLSCSPIFGLHPPVKAGAAALCLATRGIVEKFIVLKLYQTLKGVHLFYMIFFVLKDLANVNYIHNWELIGK